MASCCAPGAGAKPRGRKLVSGGADGCECSSGNLCGCTHCTCLGCPCKPERVLTSALKRTGSPEQLEDLIQRHWGRLNSVHVSAALNSLAAFVSRQQEKDVTRVAEPSTNTEQQTTPSPSSSSLLTALLGAFGRHVREMEPRALSASVWTLAILRPTSAELAPLGPLVAAAVQTHLERGSFECRDAAIVMWSYATLGPATSSHLPLGRHLSLAFEAWAVSAVGTGAGGDGGWSWSGGGGSPAMPLRDLSMVLWSAAQLQLQGIARSPAFIRGAAQILTSNAMKIEVRQLAQCLWGFATLTAGSEAKGDLGEARKTGEEEEKKLEHARFGFLRTCAALVAKPQFLSSWAVREDGRTTGERGQPLPGANPQDMSNILHSFAACRWHPGNAALRAVSVATAAASEGFKAAEAADSLWAMATLHPDACRGRRSRDLEAASGHGNGGVSACGRDVGAGRPLSCGCSVGVDDADEKVEDAATACHDDDDAVDGALSDAVTALLTRISTLRLTASESTASAPDVPLKTSSCRSQADFDPRAASNSLWAAAVLGRCTHPEVAPLWQTACTRMNRRCGSGFSEAGLVQLFYASWCFLEECERENPLVETVRRIHEYTAKVTSKCRRSDRAKTSKLQLAVAAAAAELRGTLGGLAIQAVEVEAEVIVGQYISVETTVDLLLTLASPPDSETEALSCGREEARIVFIVEVDGPTHFVRGKKGGRVQAGGAKTGCEVGGTALRNRLMRGGCMRMRSLAGETHVAGYVVLPYYVLDEAWRSAGRSGIADVLSDALVREGAVI